MSQNSSHEQLLGQNSHHDRRSVTSTKIGTTPQAMVLLTPKKKPEELGFYMPDSPFAKIAVAEGLDFDSDKTGKKIELSLQAKANDVFEEHHKGRRWAEKLALMANHTGAYRELEGVCKTPYGGVDGATLPPECACFEPHDSTAHALLLLPALPPPPATRVSSPSLPSLTAAHVPGAPPPPASPSRHHRGRRRPVDPREPDRGGQGGGQGVDPRGGAQVCGQAGGV